MIEDYLTGSPDGCKGERGAVMTIMLIRKEDQK